MSYDVFMQRFIDGAPAGVPFDVAKRVFERYGKLGRGTSGWELTFDADDIAEVAYILCEDDGGVSGLNIHRPTGFPAMRRFIFAVLVELKMCFFTQDCEAIWATEDLREHVPVDLLEQAGGRFVIVATADELWTDVDD